MVEEDFLLDRELRRRDWLMCMLSEGSGPERVADQLIHTPATAAVAHKAELLSEEGTEGEGEELCHLRFPHPATHAAVVNFPGLPFETHVANGALTNTAATL